MGLVMNINLLAIYSVITLIFGLLASASAYIITYGEQKKNNFLTEKERVRISLEAAVSAFIALAVLSFIAGYFLIRSF